MRRQAGNRIAGRICDRSVICEHPVFGRIDQNKQETITIFDAIAQIYVILYGLVAKKTIGGTGCILDQGRKDVLRYTYRFIMLIDGIVIIALIIIQIDSYDFGIGHQCFLTLFAESIGAHGGFIPFARITKNKKVRSLRQGYSLLLYGIDSRIDR